VSGLNAWWLAYLLLHIDTFLERTVIWVANLVEADNRNERPGVKERSIRRYTEMY
jgi:hypothetical protein